MLNYERLKSYQPLKLIISGVSYILRNRGKIHRRLYLTES